EVRLAPPQAVRVQPAIARERHEQVGCVAIRVARGAEHETLARTPAEQRDEPDVHARAAGVVEVRVGALEGRPHAGPAGMDEAHYRQSRVETIGPEHPYRVPARVVWLPVIPDHHAHLTALA